MVKNLSGTTYPSARITRTRGCTRVPSLSCSPALRFWAAVVRVPSRNTFSPDAVPPSGFGRAYGILGGHVAVVRRWRTMARGTVTTRRPTIQPIVLSSGADVGPLRVRVRSASTTTVMGLTSARACIRPGMVATGTIVELVKIRMMTGNTSGFRPVPRASNWFVYDDRRPCPDLSTERVLQSWILVNYSREGEGADHVRSLSLCLLL